MKSRLSRFVLPALVAVSIPAAAVLAQQSQDPSPAQKPAQRAEVRSMLQDGRIAMIKEALKLDDAQLKLWPPVEEQLRASFAARQQARAERRERRHERRQDQAARPELPDRLDRASKRLADRAERMKAYAEAIKPLYATLSEDQKAVASVVLRRPAGMRGHRWAMHRGPRSERR